MTDILERLLEALNSHDPQQVADLFAEDYRSSQPAHPGREFDGRAQVLANWTSVFEGVPDFAADLLAEAHDGDAAWGEWDWRGRYTDGTDFAMRGITIVIVRDGVIAEGRLYMSPVDRSGIDIDDAVQELYKPGGGS